MGLIINNTGRILIAQRGSHQHEGGAWELPGGKVEPGETALAALQRELEEEIGIKISQAKPLIQIPYHYPDRDMLLDVWIVEQFSGKISGMEGQPLRWVNKDEFIYFFSFLEKETPGAEKMLGDVLNNLCKNNKNF